MRSWTTFFTGYEFGFFGQVKTKLQIEHRMMLFWTSNILDQSLGATFDQQVFKIARVIILIIQTKCCLPFWFFPDCGVGFRMHGQRNSAKRVRPIDELGYVVWNALYIEDSLKILCLSSNRVTSHILIGCFSSFPSLFVTFCDRNWLVSIREASSEWQNSTTQRWASFELSSLLVLRCWWLYDLPGSETRSSANSFAVVNDTLFFPASILLPICRFIKYMKLLVSELQVVFF